MNSGYYFVQCNRAAAKNTNACKTQDRACVYTPATSAMSFLITLICAPLLSP